MSDKSGELLTGGAICGLVSFIILVAPIMQNTISGLTGISIESISFLSGIGILFGIVTFVIGLRAGKKSH